MLQGKRRRVASSFRSHGNNVEQRTLPKLAEYLDSQDLVGIKQEQTSTKKSTMPISSPTTHMQPASPPVSLLNTLPEFMALSALQTALQGATITSVWMNLAAGYMIQAAAEQYLVYGSKRPEMLQEAFAWGFDANCTAEDGSDEWLVNAMFFGEDEVLSGWERIRDEHMNAVGLAGIPGCSHTDAVPFQLIPPEGMDLRKHLETLLDGELSTQIFEDYMFSFLGGLHYSQPRPLLLQVESGNIDGLSRKQGRAFKRAVGLLKFDDA